MVVVIHRASVFHVHRMKATGSVERSWRMWIHGSGASAGIVVKLMTLRGGRNGHRWSGHFVLIVKHSLSEHVVFLLSNGSSSTSGCGSISHHTTCTSVYSAASALTSVIAVFVVTVLGTAKSETFVIWTRRKNFQIRTQWRNPSNKRM